MVQCDMYECACVCVCVCVCVCQCPLPSLVFIRVVRSTTFPAAAAAVTVLLCTHYYTNTGLYYIIYSYIIQRYFTSFVRIEVFCPDIPSLYLAHNTREEGGVVEEKRDDAEENS